jgi:hypothetical protein
VSFDALNLHRFYESAGLGSHADRDVCVKRGLLGSTKNRGLHEALAVATPAIFIRGGELEKVLGHSYETPS